MAATIPVLVYTVNTAGEYVPISEDNPLRMATAAASSAISAMTHSAKSVTNEGILVLAANTGRHYALFVNDSDSVIYLYFDNFGVVNTGIRLNALGGAYEMSGSAGNLYFGAVYGVHGALSGYKTLLVTEGV